MERRLSAILAADMVGSSRLMEADETGTLERQKRHHSELIDPRIEAHHGRIIKLTGDGLIAEFPSVVEAVQCAVSVQREMEAREADVPEEQRIRYRVAVNLGDVIVDDDEVYGNGMIVAARLEALAEPGGVVVSGTAYDHLKGSIKVGYEDLGPQQVKNIAAPVRVYRVVPDLDEAALARNAIGNGPSDLPGKLRQRAAIATAMIFVLITAVGAWWLQRTDLEPVNPAEMAQPLPDKPSIAVLPFDNISGDPDQDYFSDGITDDLITDLSRISGLFVIARNSVFTYKGEPVKIQQVGRELGVSYVLEGSVRKAGDRVRINTQLVDAATGRHLWAKRYDRHVKDVFAVQGEVAEKIVIALAIELTKTEKVELTRSPTSDVQAYDLYLRAKEHYYSGDMAQLRQSLQLYEDAISRDPTFAQARADYARAAADTWRFNNTQIMPTPLAFKTATAQATKAIEIDPNNSVAHSVLAMLYMGYGEYDQAIASARRAVYIDPNSADAYLDLAVVLGYAGDHAASLEAISKALRLNPRPPTYLQSYHGWSLIMNRRIDDAIAVLEPLRGTERNVFAARRGDSPDELLAMAYALAGRTDEAQIVVEEVLKLIPFANLAYFRSLYDHHGRIEDLDFRLEALRLAGFPAWPFGFRVDPENRINGADLKDMTVGRTWRGWDVSRNAPFLQEMNEQGAIVYAGETTFMSGTAEIRDDQICRAFPLEMIGRLQCGGVYRVDDDTDQDEHDFAYVTAPTILKFSIDK